jgi:hypothetical protein
MNLENLKFPIGVFEMPDNPENYKTFWTNQIKELPENLSTIADLLSIDELNYNYRPNGWSIKQVIHHLADSHINSFIRFKLALTENTPTIKPYEEHLWAELIDGNDNNISSSLKILEGTHEKWVTLISSLSEKDFNKQFYHPANNKKTSLIEALAFYAWHCEHHLEHIKQALKHKNNF